MSALNLAGDLVLDGLAAKYQPRDANDGQQQRRERKHGVVRHCRAQGHAVIVEERIPGLLDILERCGRARLRLRVFPGLWFVRFQPCGRGHRERASRGAVRGPVADLCE